LTCLYKIKGVSQTAKKCSASAYEPSGLSVLFETKGRILKGWIMKLLTRLFIFSLTKRNINIQFGVMTYAKTGKTNPIIGFEEIVDELKRLKIIQINIVAGDEYFNAANYN
jgi:hypothetical protein